MKVKCASMGILRSIGQEQQSFEKGMAVRLTGDITMAKSG